jgi:hypothetical protein
MSPRGDFDSERMTRPSGGNRRSAPGADARELACLLLVNRWLPRPAPAEQPPDAGAHPDDHANDEGEHPDDDGDGPGRFFAVVIVLSAECSLSGF